MRPYGEGPAWMVYRGEHSIEEIDSVMKYKEGYSMGPFELADYTSGIQIRVEGERLVTSVPPTAIVMIRFSPNRSARTPPGYWVNP